MTPIPIALAGSGIWGRKLSKILQELGCSVHVADLQPKAREIAIAEGAASAHGGLTELPVVHGVVVATPATTHAGVLNELLSLLPENVPILCEKPLTTDPVAARDLANRADGRLFVDHTWRYHPGIVGLGQIAREGKLGKVHGVRTTRANWTSPRTDVDSVWNLVPHDITLAIEILGSIPKPKAAHVERLEGRAVGMWAFLGEEPWVVLESSNRFEDKRREVRVHGELGVAVLPDIDSTGIRITYNDARTEEVPVPKMNPLRSVLEDFLVRVQTGSGGPKSGASEAAEVIERVSELRVLAGLEAAGSGLP